MTQEKANQILADLMDVCKKHRVRMSAEASCPADTNIGLIDLELCGPGKEAVAVKVFPYGAEISGEIG